MENYLVLYTIVNPSNNQLRSGLTKYAILLFSFNDGTIFLSQSINPQSIIDIEEMLTSGDYRNGCITIYTTGDIEMFLSPDI